MQPTESKGKIKLSRFSLKPMVETIHPVKVVPRFAPITIPNAFENGSMLAPTKAKVISVTTEELWSIAVVTIPVTTERKWFFVNLERIISKVLPLALLSPVSKLERAKRKIDSPASNWKNSIATSNLTIRLSLRQEILGNPR